MTDSSVDRLVDQAALRAHLESELGPAASFSVSRHRAGHSNETAFVTWGDGEFVLRRPPAGETAEKAHDVLREHRVMDPSRRRRSRFRRRCSGATTSASSARSSS